MRSALLYSTTPPPSGVHGWVRGKLDLGVNSAKTKIERVSVGVWFKVKPCVKQQQRGEERQRRERKEKRVYSTGQGSNRRCRPRFRPTS